MTYDVVNTMYGPAAKKKAKESASLCRAKMLVKLMSLLFAVLCSSTQGDVRLCPTECEVNYILLLFLN